VCVCERAYVCVCARALTLVCLRMHTYIRMIRKVITFKKKTFKDVTRGGPWVSPFMKQNLNRT
jgi:hypothetical protein